MTTILTFNFNGYDLIRPHFMSDKYHYIYVTDMDVTIPGWTVIHDPDLIEMSPWEASTYVRYHPFKYTNDDNVIIIDGSITIEPDIDVMVDTCVSSHANLALMLSDQTSCKRRISDWNVRRRFSSAEALALDIWMTELGYNDYIGCLANAVRFLTNVPIVNDYNEMCWQTIHSIMPDHIIRLDEVVATIILDKYFTDMKFIAMPISTINSSCFKYHYHKNNLVKPIKVKFQRFQTQNKNAILRYIGKEYLRTYNYKSEVMCLTRYFTETWLREWIEHHLNIGFDHIHIFDNDSPYECERICKEYGSKVSYERVSGYARHYQIYDDYVNCDRCKSEWVIPLDDDEYLELNHDICQNVHDCIDWYTDKFSYDHMFAIRWKHLFPKQFHSECTGAVLDYCTEENRMLATQFQRMGDRGVKTFVHRYGRIHYEERNENPSGGHVPKHSVVNGARLFNGEVITTCSCSHIPEEPGEPARVIHCRYKGYSWYKAKYLDITSPTYCYGNCDAIPYIKKYKFNELLPSLS